MVAKPDVKLGPEQRPDPEGAGPGLLGNAARIERLARRRTKGVISADRKFVSALGRGLLVLEAFVDQPVWLGSTDIAARVRLPKPTTSRLLRALVSLGYLHYSGRRRQYRLSTAVLALGYGVRDSFSIAQLVRPHLDRLAYEFNVHASLAGRDGLDVIQIEVSHPTRTLMTLQLEVGSRIPLAGTAMGHAILAALPEDERLYLMEHLRHRHAKHWTDIKARIEEGRAQYRERGYSWSVGSWMTDINGVAAPFVCPGGSPVLVLACGAPARHLPRKRMSEIGRRLVALSAKIEAELKERGATIFSN